MNFKNFLELPEIEKEGTIKKIKDKCNPIIIKIDDKTAHGTTIALTPGEYRRIKSTYDIGLGKKIKVCIQNFPPYQISRIIQ